MTERERLGPETRAIIEAIDKLRNPAHENLNYQVFTFDLTVARVNELFELPGWFNHLAVGKLTGQATIRLNEATKDSIDLRYTKTLTSPIHRFYLTHDAQPGYELIIAIGSEHTYAEIMRTGMQELFRYFRYSEDGAVNTFETITIETATPVLTLNTFRYPTDLKTGIIRRIHYRLNPTNVVTYTLRIWRMARAPDMQSNLDMLYESPALQADDVDYIDEDLNIPFSLGNAGDIYIGIEWTAAPGVTPGFIEVTGEKWS